MAKKSAAKKKAAHRELTAREQLFVAEYMKDLNGKKAAIRAGYSPKTAEQQASRLLRKVKVAERVAQLQREQLAAVGANAQSLLRRLLDEANADIGDIVDDDGHVMPIKQWPAAFRRGLVSGIEVEEIFTGEGEKRVKTGQIKKIKLSERTKRYELIGRHVDVQAFKDRKVLEVAEPLQQLFKQIAGQSIRPKGAA